MTVWQGVWHEMITDVSISIDTIATHLADGKKLQINDADSLHYARSLVFAIVGWQTMLYRPDMRSCSPAQLAIADETDGYRCQAYYCLRQSQTACKKSLRDLLMGFGVLLPPCNFSALASGVERSPSGAIKTATAESFNAHLLTSICGTTIHWTDCLASHMELDTLSNTMYLFRYPSFCLANLAPGNKSNQLKTAIHACAAPYQTGAPWATADEVSQLLHEIVLSYRLLFGQKKVSRRYFRSIRPFNGMPEEGKDGLLTALCGHKQFEAGYEVQDREVYDLSHDFPVLKSRITALSHHLSAKKPRTWKELWHDKRDSASWFTFWAVLILGGVGVVLAFIQVILQIVQIASQSKQF